MTGEIVSVPVTALVTLMAAKNGSPEAAMIGAAGGQITAAMVNEMAAEFSAMRGRRMRKVIEGAAYKVNTSADELIARLLGDDELAQMLFDTLQIAADAASERKLADLSEVLRRVVSSPERVDEEVIFLRVIALLEDVHVRSLALIQGRHDNAMTDADGDLVEYTTTELSRDLNLQSSIGSAVVMSLTGVGCIYTADIRMKKGLGTMLSDPAEFGLRMTSFGRYVLHRLK